MVDFAAHLIHKDSVRCEGGWLRSDGKWFEFDNGPVIAMECIDLLRALDVRGILFQRGNNDALRVYRLDGEPPEFLPGEREQIKSWKMHILAIVDRCDPPSTAVDKVEAPKQTRRRKAQETQPVAQALQK